jgi:septation ring formation regulator EzrA
MNLTQTEEKIAVYEAELTSYTAQLETLLSQNTPDHESIADCQEKIANLNESIATAWTNYLFTNALMEFGNV